MPEPFTSDLSVSEYLLVEDAGFEPLGLVVGVAFYQPGLPVALEAGGELAALGRAMHKARDLAMNRLEGEASGLRADGVVGVRLEVGWPDWGQKLIEFMAIGTAVRARAGTRGSARAGTRGERDRPFTSDLSGQDFWTLMNAGYRPAGLVMGNCVYQVARRGPVEAIQQAGRNTEMANVTRAMYDARERAITRMQTEAARCRADGVVGVRIEENHHRWGAHTMEFFVIGTAVVALPDATAIRPAVTVLPLGS
jgi:uncharacterized protein YbjQ (UPF0145 family)